MIAPTVTPAQVALAAAQAREAQALADLASARRDIAEATNARLGELATALSQAPTEDVYVDIKAVMAKLGCSDTKARQLVASGALPSTRIGTSIRIKRSDLERAYRDGVR